MLFGFQHMGKKLCWFRHHKKERVENLFKLKQNWVNILKLAACSQKHSHAQNGLTTRKTAINGNCEASDDAAFAQRMKGTDTPTTTKTEQTNERKPDVF